MPNTDNIPPGPQPQLTQLGQRVDIPLSPNFAILEKIQNAQNILYCVRLNCPEFTSTCPATGQPDFGNFTIDYIPHKYLIESKSLKLFLGSFRNHGIFHEECTTYIGKRLFDSLLPHWIRVVGRWMPRGGISIDTYWQYGSVPTTPTYQVYIPEV